MTQRLDANLSAAKIALSHLQNSPLRWTDLTKLILKESPTPWRARNIVTWLHERGYVEHERRGLYFISERGRGFLETL